MRESAPGLGLDPPCGLPRIPTVRSHATRWLSAIDTRMQASLKSTLAGIFFLALSVILFEIALTRVFAIMMWHHFTYMVISIGLLGFGASGSLLTAQRASERKGDPNDALAKVSFAYGLSVIAAFLLATRIQPDSLAIWQDKSNFLWLSLIYLVIGVPFLLGGYGIGLALTRCVKDVNRLYFADLVGSALGAAMGAFLLKACGSTASVVIAGSFGLFAAACFGFGGARRGVVLPTLGLLLGLGSAWAFGSGVLTWRVPFAPGKEGWVAEQLGFSIDRIFSSTAEVQIAQEVDGLPAFGGDNGLLDVQTVKQRTAAQDGTAPTTMYAGAADLARFPFLDDTSAATAYVAHRAAGRADLGVMVIGVGGGVDVMVALANGAKKVTAVELNSAMIEMATRRYDEYLGGLFTTSPVASRIELVNSEGRAFLRTHDTKFDVVQMSGVDSYTALSTGAYTLSESYLYTTGAVRDFFAHLTDDGIVNYSRFVENLPMQPRETLRLANIAVTALRELGVPDAERHVAVFQGQVWASTMVKKSPFRAEELAALRAFADREGFVGLIFDPLHDRTQPFAVEPQVFAARRDAWKAALAERKVQYGDDAHQPLRDLFAAAARVAAGESPSPALFPASAPADQRERAAAFLAEQQGEIRALAEYALDTRRTFASTLDPDETARAAFVRDYEYQIAPSTDDAPFFFNYYKYSNLWSGKRTSDPKLFQYHTDFPIGHLILLASVVQIVLLAAALIFWPLRKLAKEGLRTKGVWRYFGYFAALGLGFMFLEITLMQKLVIFLGHPTYALTVVLASLLGAAGTGSLLAGRIREVTQRHVRLLTTAIAVVILVDLAAVNWLLPQLLFLSLPLRMTVVVLLLVPTGLLLGVPFPTGMRVLEKQAPHLLPWGWAVNAFCSVFASIFCIVLSMAIGFTNVLLVSAAVYAIGLSMLRVESRTES